MAWDEQADLAYFWRYFHHSLARLRVSADRVRQSQWAPDRSPVPIVAAVGSRTRRREPQVMHFLWFIRFNESRRRNLRLSSLAVLPRVVTGWSQPSWEQSSCRIVDTRLCPTNAASESFTSEHSRHASSASSISTARRASAILSMSKGCRWTRASDSVRRPRIDVHGQT